MTEEQTSEYIISDPKIAHGKPTIKGTRVMVWQILELLESGESKDGINEEYPSLPEGSVEAALHYAAEQARRSSDVAFNKNNHQKIAVATKAVVFDDRGRYLVLKKSSSEDVNPDTYDLPGGRLEFGEELTTSLIREVKEETGLKVKPLRVINAWSFIKDDRLQLVGIDYLCKLLGGKETLSSEHDYYYWWTRDEILSRKSMPDWLVETLQKADLTRRQVEPK